MKKLLFIILLFVCTNAYSYPFAVPVNSNGEELGTAGNPIYTTGGSGSSIFSSDGWVNPVETAGSDSSICAGITTTTTGTISSGTSSLVVASATGWAVGMGIAVANAGTGGNTELITYITAISGTTFTVANAASATATGQTVNHDDTRCLDTAADSGKNVHLQAGTYNVTSAVTIADSMVFQGDGSLLLFDQDSPQSKGAIIQNRGTTNHVLTVSAGSVFLRDFAIRQAAGITPTAGYQINYTHSSRIANGVFENISLYHGYGCLSVGPFVATSYFNKLYCLPVGTTGAGVLIVNPIPYGDLFFTDITILMDNHEEKGLWIRGSDQMQFQGIKINGAEPCVEIDDGVGVVQNVHFVNNSFEGSNANPLIRMGGGAPGTIKNISFVGNEIASINAVGQSPILMNNYSENILIDGNLILGASSIYVNTTGQQIIISNNIIEGNGSSTGITLGTDANNVVIVGNVYPSIGTKINDLSGADNIISLASGNLSINTTNGINSLDVANPVAIGAAYAGQKRVAADSLGVSGNIGIGTWQPTNSLIVATGNVGIGTARANQSLQVAGTIDTQGFKLNTSPAAGSVLVSSSVGVGTWMATSSLGGSTAPGGSNTQVQYNNSSAFGGSSNFVFDGTNVGIGSVTPTGIVNVLSASGQQSRVTINAGNSAQSPGVEMGWPGNTNATIVRTDQLGTNGANMTLWSKADGGSVTQKAVISGPGNLGIGTANPGFQIDMTGGLRSTNTADFGWSVVSGANTACNTTCTRACIVGVDLITAGFLACTDATADSCLCAGGS